MAPDPLRDELIALVRANPGFMRDLAAVRGLGLPDWCIGAGAVRNLVWDALHARTTASALADVDVAYYDPRDTTRARDHGLQARLRAVDPDIPWDVTNQAGVHLWFAEHFGDVVEPLRSLAEAVAAWPEYATAVAVTLGRDGAIEVIAPHGLDDLFDLVVRRNPARVSVATYRQRIATKCYAARWPRVRIVDA